MPDGNATGDARWVDSVTSMAPAAERAVRRFRVRFDSAPNVLIRSPGRVNLIGEHTDYNDGYVLPLATQQALWLAATFDGDDAVVVSDDVEGEVRVELDDVGDRRDDWGVYVQAVAWALANDGRALRGWHGAVAADIPAGAGLSSSAALELAVARALVVDDGWEPVAMALVAQRAENRWVGVESGIMDQLASATGKRGHALLIDCRTLDVEHFPVPDDLTVVVMDTGTRRQLANSEFNERQAECAAAADALGVPALRDATIEAVERLEDAVLRRRARHVVTENTRTLEAGDAMRAGDDGRLGELLAASHASLRDDFEASSRELDAIVTVANAAPGCIGARMTGAGFGGCAIALVARNELSAFTARVADRYQRETGLQPGLYVTRPADGTEMTTYT